MSLGNNNYECPESERFLDSDEIMRGHTISFTAEDCIKNFTWGECNGSCRREYLENTEFYLIDQYCKEQGYEQFVSTETKTEKGEIIKTEKAIQGFYVDSTKTRAIISNVTNLDLLPKAITGNLQNLEETIHKYEGYEYLLIKTANGVSTFSIGYFNSVHSVLQSVNNYIICRIQKILVSKEGSVLVMDTGKTKFLIAGIIVHDSEEIERNILSEKIEAARPFFEYKSVHKVDWTKLHDNKGDTFEKLVETLLPMEPNIISIESIGKTNASDRGRDFIITEKTYNTFGTQISKKWLAQCKFSTHSISTKTVPDWVTRAVEHSVDGYWLITNNDLTPDLYDQLMDVPKNPKYKLETKFWQRNTFDIKLATRPEIFISEHFFKI